MIGITPGDLDDPRVVRLLQFHLANAQEHSARCSAHALDVAGLRSPDIEFWTAWDDATLLGFGALRRLSDAHGEVKSMHTAPSMRRLGIGRAILRHIIAIARSKDLSRLSLETGSGEYFVPAQALYRSHGFVVCPPFAGYRADPNSVFMSLDLNKS